MLLILLCWCMAIGADFIEYLQVNMPKCPFHNNHMDGAMNYTIRDEEVSS